MSCECEGISKGRFAAMSNYIVRCYQTGEPLIGSPTKELAEKSMAADIGPVLGVLEAGVWRYVPKRLRKFYDSELGMAVKTVYVQPL